MRFAIVGVGDISHQYLKQAAIDPRIEFVGASARTLESAQRVAEQYGIPAWFDDFEAMYDQVAPDVVIVATPSAHHVVPTLAALQRGIHVVCEKPMATSYDDCRAMVDAARENGVLLRLQSDSKTAPAPFEATLAELERDHEWLVGELQDRPRR